MLHWLIETIFDSEQTLALAEAAKKQGHAVTVVRNCFSWSNEDFLKAIPAGSIVISSTSIVTARQIARLPWYPGTFCNLNEYSCSQYFPQLHDYLLNDNYVMLPYGALKGARTRLFDMFGSRSYDWVDSLFIRPNSGFKIFDGQVVTYADFDKTIDYLAHGQLTSDKIVLIAPPQQIWREWRIFAAPGGMITGSQYKANGELEIDGNVPKEVYDFAMECHKSKKYLPDKVMSIDVAHSEDGLRLIEVGAFSTSGIYASDASMLVDVVSSEAVAWFEENQ